MATRVMATRDESPKAQGVRRLARAKVNLTLQVLGRRPDGYHELESLVVFAEVADRLDFAAADSLSLSLSGPFAKALDGDQDNLVLRAARALWSLSGKGGEPGAAIRLEKNLPVAAGLGGGSADAAAALDGLLELWGLRPDPKALFGLARELGADVPVCLHGQPSLMRGLGERMEPAPALPDFSLLLANPGVPLSTPAVFAARRGAFSPALDWPESFADFHSFIEALRSRGNDLQAAAIALAPEIGQLLEALRALPGCAYAAMSGSGASCFALFAEAPAAVEGAERLRSQWPRCWSRLGGPLRL